MEIFGVFLCVLKDYLYELNSRKPLCLKWYPEESYLNRDIPEAAFYGA